jgi:hypothetical protein
MDLEQANQGFAVVIVCALALWTLKNTIFPDR